MGLFRGGKKDKKTQAAERTMAECIRMVEGFFRQVGLDPKNQRLPDQNVVGWWIVRGSALIYVTLYEGERIATLRMVSPILYLPDERIVALYRRCLELNSELLNCALGVFGDRIAVVSERPIVGLDPEELKGTLDYLSAVADDLDDKLADEFNARLYGGRRIVGQ